MFESLRQKAATLWAARDFPAPHVVTLLLDPSIVREDLKLDRVTAWARSEDRMGMSRRTMHAGLGEVVFEFESEIDARNCQQRFG
tara:strand:- start:5405 stop:5659 length:255 start_codon:yes stop_codon:yes gene_type:complete